MEWKTVRLGDFISIKSGLAYQGCKIGSGDSLLLGMGCVSFKDKFVESGARPYDDVVDDRFCVVPGDIVLATRQQSDNLPILAMPAIVPQSFEGKRIIFGTNLYKVDNHSEISNRFLFWLLKHQHYVNYIAGVKSGTAVQMVTKKNVEDYKFLCPSKEEREKIADILWAYDSLIENNQKRIKLLEQMAENLYKEWFVRFRFPGYESAEFEGGVPKGWSVKRVKECVNRLKFGLLYDKKSVEPEGIIIVIDQSLDPYIGFHNNAPSHIADVNKPIILFGDHSCKFELMIIPFSLAENVVPFIAQTGFSTLYLYFATHKLIETTEYKRHWTEFVNKKVFIPPVSLQQQFEEKIKKCLLMKQNLLVENRFLIKQRDLLLPRLMSGKLEVNALKGQHYKTQWQRLGKDK